MAGIATIANPGNLNEILLFHNTSNNYLAIERRSASSKSSSGDYSAADSGDNGNVPNKSSLATLRQNDLV